MHAKLIINKYYKCLNEIIDVQVGQFDIFVIGIYLSEIGQFDRPVQPDLMQQSAEFEHPHTPIFHIVDIAEKVNIVL